MPRQARKRSGNGIYHVLLRGINCQIERLTGINRGVVQKAEIGFIDSIKVKVLDAFSFCVK